MLLVNKRKWPGVARAFFGFGRELVTGITGISGPQLPEKTFLKMTPGKKEGECERTRAAKTPKIPNFKPVLRI